MIASGWKSTSRKTRDGVPPGTSTQLTSLVRLCQYKSSTELATLIDLTADFQDIQDRESMLNDPKGK
jgi:hypothetical protein